MRELLLFRDLVTFLYLGVLFIKNKNMKRLFTKGILLMAFAMISLGYSAQAQGGLDGLLEGGLDDANDLAEGYLTPFMNAFGTGLTNGWYNTAKAHKTAGFDLTVTVNAAFVPDEDLFYNASNLTTVTLDDPNYPNGKVPTMFGPSTAPIYRDNLSGDTFEGPEGLNVKDEFGVQAVPVPMAQLGIGIVKNTDIKIRWTPEISLGEDEGKFKLIGFGVMHDVKQWIPGLKNVPFELSGFVGYTKMTLSTDFADQSSSSGSGVYTDNGEGVFEVNSLTFQALISKKISVLTLYGGVGVNSVKSKIALEGDYRVEDANGIIEDTFTDPISLNFKTGGPRVTAGFRLKLAILTLHADYTLQKYSTLTAGIGFSVR